MIVRVKQWAAPAGSLHSSTHRCRRRHLVLAMSLVLSGAAMAQDFPAVIPLSTLDGTTGFRINGLASYDSLGLSVSDAGDVNGDGIDDLIIGAFDATVNGQEYAGSSYVVFGQRSPFAATLDLAGLDGSNGFRLDGVATFDNSGRAVSAAGDINGDGVDDLLIGAPGVDPNGLDGAGSSYVVFGRDTLTMGDFAPILALASLDGSNGFRLDGVALTDGAGSAVSAAGDINGDGVDDLIIGARGADPNGVNFAGSSYVVFGRLSPFAATLNLASLDGSNGFRVDGVAELDTAGRGVSGAGDINGDGVDDLVIGAQFADPNGDESGSSYVVFGRDTSTQPDFPAALALASLDGSNGFRLDGVAIGDFAGSAVSDAGDINGDGVDDLIIGALGLGTNGDRSGGSYVVFGRDTSTQPSFPATLALAGLDGSNGFRLDGVATFDLAGGAVSGVGDINGDGLDDLIIGANGAEPNGDGSGSTYVVFGRDTSIQSGFPATLALATLDGTDGFRLDGTAAYDNSGGAVSGAGDINGDGIDDLLIGAFFSSTNGNFYSGSSFVVFGGNDGPGRTIAVTASPDRVDFVTPDLAPTPLVQTVTLTNTGTVMAQLDTLSLSGSAQFTFANDSCSGQLLGTTAGVDDSCEFDIELLPDQPGAIEATVLAPYPSTFSPELIQIRAFPDGIFTDGFEN